MFRKKVMGRIVTYCLRPLGGYNSKGLPGFVADGKCAYLVTVFGK